MATFCMVLNALRNAQMATMKTTLLSSANHVIPDALLVLLVHTALHVSMDLINLTMVSVLTSLAWEVSIER
jgi:hypothetical protein